MPTSFDDIQVGQVISLGAAVVDGAVLASFVAAFDPEWSIDQGAPDAMTYAIWCRLEARGEAPRGKRLGVDAALDAQPADRRAFARPNDGHGQGSRRRGQGYRDRPT